VVSEIVRARVGSRVGHETIAAAILDRLLHHSHTLVIKGESYRLKAKKRAGLLGRDT
jgi:DNA replication protein DnaC